MMTKYTNLKQNYLNRFTRPCLSIICCCHYLLGYLVGETLPWDGVRVKRERTPDSSLTLEARAIFFYSALKGNLLVNFQSAKNITNWKERFLRQLKLFNYLKRNKVCLNLICMVTKFSWLKGFLEFLLIFYSKMIKNEIVILQFIKLTINFHIKISSI